MKVYCPYCKKEVDYKIEERQLKEFRGIEINTYENVAICKECNNDLYVDKIERDNIKRIYEIYRDKANIIKPQDIIELRGKYNISQRELTSILGFGKMTINRYEKGGVPTKSQSDYIKLLIANDSEFIKKANEAYKNSSISQKTYEKIVSKQENNKVSKEDIQDLFAGETSILDGGNANSDNTKSSSDTITLAGARTLVEELAKKIPKVKWEEFWAFEIPNTV